MTVRYTLHSATPHINILCNLAHLLNKKVNNVLSTHLQTSLGHQLSTMALPRAGPGPRGLHRPPPIQRLPPSGPCLITLTPWSHPDEFCRVLLSLGLSDISQD
jgi:hypothetical protein